MPDTNSIYINPSATLTITTTPVTNEQVASGILYESGGILQQSTSAIQTTGILLKGNTSLMASNGTFSAQFPEKSGTVAMTSDVGGVTIGNAVTGGGVNRVLYEDGSELLAASTSLTFTGSVLATSGLTVDGSPGPGLITINGSSTSISVGTTFNLNNSDGNVLQVSASGNTITVLDAYDIPLGSTTGTKIGTATTQKLAFYNSTPVVQPTGSVATALQTLGLVGSATYADLLAAANTFTNSSGNTFNIQNNTTSANSAVLLTNTTAATAGVTIQNSPALEYKGTARVSGASKVQGMRAVFVPSTADTRGSLRWDYSSAGSYTTDVMSFNNANGVLSLAVASVVCRTNGISVTGGISAGTSGIALNIVTKTADYTIVDLVDYTVLADTTSGNISITLPTPAANVYSIFNIKKIAAANTLTIVGTVDGVVNPTVTTNMLNTQVQSNGTSYFTL